MIPDFKEKTAAKGDEAEAKQEDLKWQLRFQAALTTEKKAEGAATRALKQLTAANQRKANQFYGFALDRALQLGVGGRLADFNTTEPGPRPMKAFERRY